MVTKYNNSPAFHVGPFIRHNIALISILMLITVPTWGMNSFYMGNEKIIFFLKVLAHHQMKCVAEKAKTFN